MSPRQLGIALTSFVLLTACSDSEATGGGGPPGCTPGETQSCSCTDGSEGAQKCASDGKSFGECECAGNLDQCGDGVKDPGEVCDDGNDDDSDGCTRACQPMPFCGDGIVTAPESCDDGGVDSGEGDTCPEDCAPEGGGGGMGGAGGGGEGGMGGGACDPLDTVIFAAIVPNQTSAWTSNGLVGLDAGQDLCNAAALGSHVCRYEELLVAEGKADNLEPVLTNLANGTTLWVHRDTPELVNNVMSPPGPGGRCNDWIYNTNHISDGEYATVGLLGDLTFFLDNDTFYDGVSTAHVLMGQLECNGELRAIPCCNPCIDPPAP